MFNLRTSPSLGVSGGDQATIGGCVAEQRRNGGMAESIGFEPAVAFVAATLPHISALKACASRSPGAAPKSARIVGVLTRWSVAIQAAKTFGKLAKAERAAPGEKVRAPSACLPVGIRTAGGDGSQCPLSPRKRTCESKVRFTPPQSDKFAPNTLELAAELLLAAETSVPTSRLEFDFR